ncbi:hypothetical protein [Paenibacillus camerounensis]|nr:hypothetical protein [Paenibacillus camerounensis]
MARQKDRITVTSRSLPLYSKVREIVIVVNSQTVKLPKGSRRDEFCY